MISSGSRLRNRLGWVSEGGLQKLGGPNVHDGRIGRLGWRSSYQHQPCLIVISQLKSRLQRDENAVLDLILKHFPDNRILGGK